MLVRIFLPSSANFLLYRSAFLSTQFFRARISLSSHIRYSNGRKFIKLLIRIWGKSNELNFEKLHNRLFLVGVYMSNLFKNTFRYKKSDKYKMWRYLACFVGHIYPRDIENSLESIFFKLQVESQNVFSIMLLHQKVLCTL